MRGEQTQRGLPQTSEQKLQQLCPITQKHVQQQLPWFIYLSERVQNSLYGYRLKCKREVEMQISLYFCSSIALRCGLVTLGLGCGLKASQVTSK